jgi:aspartyl-tRNA(Asn)/glutamyl-tRNA(Gln) amidotransferase subunit C
MSVTRRDVDHIAVLARLRLGPEETDRMVRDLNAILEHADALAAADEESAPPYEVGPDRAPERDPGQVPPDPLERPPSAVAPDWMDGFYVVPRLVALDDQ